jgi:hypothetical protein
MARAIVKEGPDERVDLPQARRVHPNQAPELQRRKITARDPPPDALLRDEAAAERERRMVDVGVGSTAAWTITLAAVELDHVTIAVADLVAAGREIEARHGLASIDGGRHPGWGTANRIVPLGQTYLELIAVVDQAEAAKSFVGSWVAQASPVLAQPLGWAVRTDNLDEVARRLGLVVTPGSRATRGGQLRWRTAGIEQAAAEPSLPFFIEWEHGTPLPGHAPATHRSAGIQIAKLQLDGDPDRLAAWLGTHQLPITIRPGAPALSSITLTGAAGEIVLAAERL